MTEKMDVLALGELLIDFTENGKSGQGNGLFEACPGGAPCNVLAMLRKLNKSCGFIGKVDVSELMGSSVHLHVTSMDRDVVIIVSTMNMTGAEVSALTGGAKVNFTFGGNVCHVFNKETGINLEA